MVVGAEVLVSRRGLLVAGLLVAGLGATAVFADWL